MTSPKTTAVRELAVWLSGFAAAVAVVTWATPPAEEMAVPPLTRIEPTTGGFMPPPVRFPPTPPRPTAPAGLERPSPVPSAAVTSPPRPIPTVTVIQPPLQGRSIALVPPPGQATETPRPAPTATPTATVVPTPAPTRTRKPKNKAKGVKNPCLVEHGKWLIKQPCKPPKDDGQVHGQPATVMPETPRRRLARRR